MKRKLKKKTLFSMLVLLLIIVLIISLVIKKLTSDNRRILGSWISTGGTVYTFNKNGKGVMNVPLADYKYSYKIKDGKIIIDFKDDRVNDAKYDYTLKKNKLTLKNNLGTFNFTRKE